MTARTFEVEPKLRRPLGTGNYYVVLVSSKCGMLAVFVYGKMLNSSQTSRNVWEYCSEISVTVFSHTLYGTFSRENQEKLPPK